MSAVTKLTAEQIENLAKEIREFLLEHGLWQDVDIYFNGKKYTSYDPENGEYYYNDREHLIEVADQHNLHHSNHDCVSDYGNSEMVRFD